MGPRARAGKRVSYHSRGAAGPNTKKFIQRACLEVEAEDLSQAGSEQQVLQARTDSQDAEMREWRSSKRKSNICGEESTSGEMDSGARHTLCSNTSTRH